jgi:hypothetical protein
VPYHSRPSQEELDESRIIAAIRSDNAAPDWEVAELLDYFGYSYSIEEIAHVRAKLERKRKRRKK